MSIRAIGQGIVVGLLCLFTIACGVSATSANGGQPIPTATASSASASTPTAVAATATPNPGAFDATGTPAIAINCGQIFQQADGTIAPPAPNYQGETQCFTSAFQGCQPAFLEFIAHSAAAVNDYTLEALLVKSACQVYVNQLTTASNGSNTHSSYYCTSVTQNGAKAVFTGCDKHYTSGTISVPA